MLERLESRQLLSNDITVFVGVQPRRDLVGRGYVGSEGHTVWIDYNDNGKQDSRDKIAVTGDDGMAGFSNLRDGRYTVHLEDLSYPYLDAKKLTRTLTTQVTQTGGLVINVGGYSPPDADAHFLIVKDVPQYNFLTGQVFFDDDHSGTVTDSSGGTDRGVVGVRVYLDINRNGTRDKAEPSTLTKATGWYDLVGMTMYEVTAPIRISTPAGYSNTTSTSINGKEDHQAFFGVFKQEKTAVIHFRTHLQRVAPWTAHGGYLVYLDFNRDSKWQRGEPRTTTDEDGLATFNVFPGKYRMRVITPPTLTVDRRYVDVKIAHRQTRSRNFVLNGAQEYFIGFYFDANNDGDRDAGEPLLSRYRSANTAYLLVDSAEYSWYSNTANPRITDSRGYMQLSKVPGTLQLSYEIYRPGSSFPTIPKVSIPNTIASGGVWEIPISYVPEYWYELYPELTPFAP